MDIICEYDKCTGCSLCFDVCSHGAIQITENNDGFIFPQIDNAKCVDCGLCKKRCPVLNPERLNKNNLSDLKVYEGWSLNEDIRRTSSSGGIFGQLANDNLINKGIVLGVEYKNKKAFHTVISDVKDLNSLQNTKYIQSYASGVYKETFKYLLEGKNVIFSGTPCQVAACQSYLMNKTYSGRLLTIEVICHGVPSYLTLKNAIKFNKAVDIVSFRNKDDGWGYHSQKMEYTFQNNDTIVKDRNDDIFYRMFFSEKFLRPSCYSCPFAKMPRVADITIGDSWGTQNNNSEEIYKGLSLVIVNNNNGLKWLTENKNIVLRKNNWIKSIYINRNIYTPFPPQYLIEDRITDIKSFFKNSNLEDFIKQTKLGFKEEILGFSNIKLRLYTLNKMIRERFLENIQISKILSFKFKLLIWSLKIDMFLSNKPSIKYLDQKFINFLFNIYNSKK